MNGWIKPQGLDSAGINVSARRQNFKRRIRGHWLRQLDVQVITDAQVAAFERRIHRPPLKAEGLDHGRVPIHFDNDIRGRRQLQFEVGANKIPFRRRVGRIFGGDQGQLQQGRRQHAQLLIAHGRDRQRVFRRRGQGGGRVHRRRFWRPTAQCNNQTQNKPFFHMSTFQSLQRGGFQA